jgi:tRNA1Val (adenine37-N6)-methyltransferase
MDVTFDSIRDILLYQSKKGYRFSVDSLLLYDFVNLKEVPSIADLGAGSGIVGILLAKKYPRAFVDLFELQDSLFRLAEKNVLLNNIGDRVKVIHCDLRNLPVLAGTFRSYDLVVANPPYRKLKSGLLNIEEEKAIARHEIKLSLHEFIDATASLLRTKGRLCLIYHPSRLSELIDALRKKDIEPKRLRFVHSTLSSEAKIFLLEAVKGGRTGLKVDNPLYLYNQDGSYTAEMENIYGIF